MSTVDAKAAAPMLEPVMGVAAQVEVLSAKFLSYPAVMFDVYGNGREFDYKNTPQEEILNMMALEDRLFREFDADCACFYTSLTPMPAKPRVETMLAMVDRLAQQGSAGLAAAVGLKLSSLSVSKAGTFGVNVPGCDLPGRHRISFRAAQAMRAFGGARGINNAEKLVLRAMGEATDEYDASLMAEMEQFFASIEKPETFDRP